MIKALCILLGVACNERNNNQQHIELPTRAERGLETCGTASWYGRELAGRLTANGERFDPSKLTGATWEHRFDTRLFVRNPKNGRSVTIRINDRGPNKRLERILDLSREAFRKIGRLRKGLIKVCYRVVK